MSATNIAEGALNELTTIVTRLQELAEQAANGTLGAKQRGALDAEAQALSKEYFRIAKTTEFNSQKLFDGGLQGLSLQAGYATSGSLLSSLGGTMGTGGLKAVGNFAAGNDPEAVELGDLNGDGMLDMVSINYLGDSASVLLGNGDGTFKTKTNFATGAGPESMALADLNNDGVLDIIAANVGGDSVSVLLGNGDGTFKGKTDLTTLGVTAMAVNDLNGDGILDIVSSNFGGTASVLLGKGDGSFQANGTFAMGGGFVRDLSFGDLNGDGAVDIVAARSVGNMTAVLLGNGNGTFKARSDYATPGNPEEVALGDLNRDGFLDVVAVAGGAAVRLGNGDGTLGSQTDYTTGPTPASIALGDLNSDGLLDIVCANSGSNTTSVLLGNGDGTFNAKSDLVAGANTSSVALGDLNRDGVLDLAAANALDDNISCFLSQTRDGVAPLLNFSLKTKADAKWALELMKQKLTQLSQQRGIIGANQSRLSSAVANLQVGRENYDSARSQITDVDVASESSRLLKTQILQQAASAVLAQANQAPALALRLLQG